MYWARSRAPRGRQQRRQGGRPVQVKQQDRVGRNVVDNFETAIKRKRKTRGMIVAFSFGKGAVEEAARAKNEEGLEIELKRVEDLLREG